jgi:hypothetical protein
LLPFFFPGIPRPVDHRQVFHFDWLIVQFAALGVLLSTIGTIIERCREIVGITERNTRENTVKTKTRSPGFQKKRPAFAGLVN